MSNSIIIKCTDCPFNGQDNVYCRTCSIPITKEEFKERLESLIREYDWSYTDEWTFFSTDEHSMFDVEIRINRGFRLE